MLGGRKHQLTTLVTWVLAKRASLCAAPLTQGGDITSQNHQLHNTIIHITHSSLISREIFLLRFKCEFMYINVHLNVHKFTFKAYCLMYINSHLNLKRIGHEFTSNNMCIGFGTRAPRFSSLHPSSRTLQHQGRRDGLWLHRSSLSPFAPGFSILLDAPSPSAPPFPFLFPRLSYYSVLSTPRTSYLPNDLVPTLFFFLIAVFFPNRPFLQHSSPLGRVYSGICLNLPSPAHLLTTGSVVPTQSFTLDPSLCLGLRSVFFSALCLLQVLYVPPPRQASIATFLNGFWPDHVHVLAFVCL